MCGIAGVIKLDPSADWRMSPEVAARILSTLSYRGPDGIGQWTSPDGLCWLGHTRLAIIDRAGGHQPMANEDGSLQVVFNGEIYNHAIIRAELEVAGHRFASHCDTEVLVHGTEQWGTALPARLRGMFAYAAYDTRARQFTLARDRLGIKPLYYTICDQVLIFASEIKAILAYPGVKREVDPTALLQYLTFRYVPAPLTMFKGIYKMPAGHVARLQLRAADPSQRSGGAAQAAAARPLNPEPRTLNPGHPSSFSSPYWDVHFRHDPVPFAEALDKTDALLKDAVSSHLMSDVPLGAQLSGGVDSSLIVAQMELLRREGGYAEPVRTFAIGFDHEAFSELPYARQVAQQYNTEHHEVTVGYADFIGQFARLCWVYDEPVSEPAAIPTYLLCKFARQHVTVMLTGEGGDELFGGYPKCAADQWSKYLAWMPAGMRRGLLRGAASLLPFSKRRARIALENLAIFDEAERLSAWFAGFDSAGVAGLVRPEVLRSARVSAPEHLRNVLAGCDSPHPLDRMLYADLHTWLVDDLLIKGDRMSMASSVEARVPFLDHPLVEYAATLPPAYKAKGRRTKILLKKLAERYIPRETIYRRKVGFTVPISPWFRGPLAGFVKEMLLGDRAASRNYFHRPAVEKLVNDHLSGKTDQARALWTLLSLEVWHRLFVDDDGSQAAAGRLGAEMGAGGE